MSNVRIIRPAEPPAPTVDPLVEARALLRLAGAVLSDGPYVGLAHQIEIFLAGT